MGNRRTLLLIAALVIAGLGTSLILLYVKSIDARAQEGMEMVEVLTVTETIEAGELVSEAQAAGKIEPTDVTKDDMLEGALNSTDAVADQVALGPIYPGEQLIPEKFGAPGSAQSLTVPDDKLAVSVELTDPARVAGFVTPGSEVAIFASADPKLIRADGSTQDLASVTSLLLPKVQVIGVGQTTVQTRTTTNEEGEQTTEEVPRTILTVAVSQEEAEKVIYGSRNGELAFALLNDESKVKVGPGVDAADIFPDVFKGVS